MVKINLKVNLIFEKYVTYYQDVCTAIYDMSIDSFGENRK